MRGSGAQGLRGSGTQGLRGSGTRTMCGAFCASPEAKAITHTGGRLQLLSPKALERGKRLLHFRSLAGCLMLVAAFSPQLTPLRMK